MGGTGAGGEGVTYERRQVRCADGTCLLVRCFRPRAGRSARGAVLAVHAMMASGAYFDRPRGQGLASTLAQAGLEAYVLDLRGHGGSVPPLPREGGWGFDDYVRLDLPAALEAVAGWAGTAPTSLGYIGHSLGGLVALAFAGTRPAEAPARLALVSVSIWNVRRLEPAVIWRWPLLRLFLGAARLVGHAPIRRLRIGTDDEPRSYVEDLCRFAMSGEWRSRDGRVDYRAALGSVPARTLAVVGSADRWATPADVRALLAGLPPGSWQLLEVGRRHGFPLDADHFGAINDPRARPVWDALAGFLAGDAQPFNP